MTEAGYSMLDLVTPRELTAELVQEYLRDLQEDCPPDGRLPMPLVDVITRMTRAGMTKDEIAERLAGVEWAPGRRLEATTVAFARQVAAGSRGTGRS